MVYLCILPLVVGVMVAVVSPLGTAARGLICGTPAAARAAMLM